MQKTIVFFQMVLKTDNSVRVDIKCLTQTADRVIVASVEKTPGFEASTEVLVKEFGNLIGKEVNYKQIRRIAGTDGTFDLYVDGVLVTDIDTPDAPVLTLVHASDDTADISWTEPDDDGGNIESYEIQSKLDAGAYAPVASAPFGLNNYHFTGLAVGTHTFQVRAIDSLAHIGPFSNEVQVVVVAAP